jgi:ABC-type xylose transport system permease subunit
MNIFKALIFWLISLVPFIVAAVPRWRASCRWYGRPGKNPPMSATGIRLVGLFFAVLGLGALLNATQGVLYCLLLGIEAVILLAMIPVYLADRRNSG